MRDLSMDALRSRRKTLPMPEEHAGEEHWCPPVLLPPADYIRLALLSVDGGEEEDAARLAVSVGIVDGWEIALFEDVLRELEKLGAVEHTAGGWRRADRSNT